MSRIAYVNGRFQPIAAPAVAVEDRGLQFADGVYEVVKAIDGRLCDLDRHLDRLGRSLAQLAIGPPMSQAALKGILRETLRRNRLAAALVYVQVDRGVAPRNHVLPAGVRPSVIVTARRATFPTTADQVRGVKVITLPDPRWQRCDIKSVSLLANVLARQRAAEAGCREAWLLDRNGQVTEGSSSNAFIVDDEGRLVTRPLGPEILGGITRAVLLELAERAGIEVALRPFALADAMRAREAFLTSTSSLVLPIVEIDGRRVGDGAPGTTTRMLLAGYLKHLRANA